MPKKDKNIEEMDRLFHLKGLDEYKVADYDLDIRGWDVVTSDGKRVGTVDDLVVDLHAMKVRYVDVLESAAATGKATNRHVLIPIGMAALDEGDDQVHLPTIDTQALLRIPAHEGEKIHRDYELLIRDALQADHGAAKLHPGEDFYTHSHFDEARFRERRRRQAETGTAYDHPGSRPYFERRKEGYVPTKDADI